MSETHPLYARFKLQLFGLALLVVPPLIELLVYGRSWLVSYFAMDANYYFVVARNFSRMGFFTFDGENATNGFHPLWQFFLGILYFLMDAVGLDFNAFILIVFLTNLALMAIVYFLLGEALKKSLGAVPQFYLLIPAGFYAILMLPFALGTQMKAFTVNGTLWGFVNGMESVFVLLFYVLSLLALVHYDFVSTWKGALLTGLCLALMTLSRLDHVLFPLVICGWIGFESALKLDLKKLLRGIVMGLPVLFFVGAYLYYSWRMTGAPLPVSGALKSSFPHIQPHLQVTLSKIGFLGGGRSGLSHLWRFCQIVIPVFFALICVVRSAVVSWRNRACSPFERAHVITAIFVVALGAYNFLYVQMMHQGGWYFPVALLFVSLEMLVWFQRRKPKPKLAYWVCSFAVIALFIFGMITRHSSDYLRWYYAQEAQAIQAHYGETPPKIVDADDAIVAAVTGFQALSGSGLCLDIEGIEAKENHAFLELAHRRGYTHYASFSYLKTKGLAFDANGEEIGKMLKQLPGYIFDPVELNYMDFRVDYLSENGLFAIFTFQPKSMLPVHAWDDFHEWKTYPEFNIDTLNTSTQYVTRKPLDIHPNQIDTVYAALDLKGTDPEDVIMVHLYWARSQDINPGKYPFSSKRRVILRPMDGGKLVWRAAFEGHALWNGRIEQLRMDIVISDSDKYDAKELAVLKNFSLNQGMQQ